VLVGILGAVLVVLMLAEFFVTFLLPRRVKRDVRLARNIDRLLWIPWRGVGRRLPAGSGDTWLGFFGPLSLVFTLLLWILGLIVGFAAIQWALGSHLASSGTVNFGRTLYFSAGDFFSASTSLTPQTTGADIVGVLEAATALAVLFVVIGYLPALFQAYSRREIAVSQMAPRAGSPPTAGGLLRHSMERERWSELDAYLEDWETWAAELMETHLSYPVLAFFRSQHLNQSWLGALVVVMDTSSVRIASTGGNDAVSAELSYAIGRHALADLAYMFRVSSSADVPERLGEGDFQRLREIASRCGAAADGGAAMRERLSELRAGYEPQAQALARHLELPLPQWLP